MAPPSNQVDVWRLSLDGLDQSTARLSPLLSPDETGRAARFHFAKDRDRYTFVRGCLRIILAERLDLAPAQVAFRYGKAGKPCIATDQNDFGVTFNVSHSGEIAVIAVARGREVGVDIERIRSEVNLRDIAEQFFSARESAEIFSLRQELWPKAFFDCWTRKEAYVKALGEGLNVPLHTFGVSVKPDAPAELTFVDAKPDELNRWTMRDISPDREYSSALVVEGVAPDIRLQNSFSSTWLA